jgi:hypothetical protein
MRSYTPALSVIVLFAPLVMARLVLRRRTSEIRLPTRRSWSWRRAGIVALVLSPLVAAGAGEGWTGVFVLGTFALVTALAAGFAPEPTELEQVPHAPVWRAARSAAIHGVAFTAFASSIFTLSFLLDNEEFGPATIGAIALAPCLLLTTLAFGGMDVVNHLVLLRRLRAELGAGVDLYRLLDDAVRLILMVRVGPGHMFVHRGLLDCLADRTATALVAQRHRHPGQVAPELDG